MPSAEMLAGPAPRRYDSVGETSHQSDVFEKIWRVSLQVVLVYLVFEGMVSLILFEHKLALLIKDAFLGVAYIAFAVWWWRSRPSLQLPRILLLPLVAFVLVASFAVFNSNVDNPLVALVGVRTRLYYIPLLAMGYYFLKDAIHLRALGLLIAISSIPANLVAFVQYLLGPQRVAQWGEGFAVSIWQIGMFEGAPVYRPVATFSSPGHHAAFLLFATAITAAMCLSPHVSPFRLQMLRLALVLQFAGVMVGGARTALLFAPLAVAAVSAQALFGLGRARGPVRRAAILNVALLAAGLFLGWLIAPTGVYRAESVVAPTYDKFQLSVFDVVRISADRIATLSSEDLVAGHGLGTASPGSRYIIPDTTDLRYHDVLEGLVGQFVWEMGLFGLLSFMLSWLALIFLGIQVYRRLERPELRAVASAIVVYDLLLLATSGTYTLMAYAPTSVAFWVLNGILLGLGHLDSQRDPPNLPKVTAIAT